MATAEERNNHSERNNERNNERKEWRLEKRQPNPYRRPRLTAFYSPDTGMVASETSTGGTTFAHLSPRGGAPALLQWVADREARERPRVVFVCAGERTAPPPAWWHAPAHLADADAWGLTRWYAREDSRTAVYERNGLEIDVRMGAIWFGEEPGAARDPMACLEARYKLRRGLQYMFGDGAALLNTPGMTGCELLEMAFPARLSMPPLDAALAEEIRGFSTQGRREWYAAPDDDPEGPDDLPAVLPEGATLLDAVWQYAACLNWLPTGPVRRDSEFDYAGHIPGFYRVTARVPRGWSGVGLLPYRESDGSISYPATPGTRFDCWITGAEYDLATNPDYGALWPLAIRERILYPATPKLPNLAKNWIGNLRALRSAFQRQETSVAQLAAGAVRHLVIDTIGRWHAAGREEWGLLPLSRIGELPPGAIPHILNNGLVQYMRPVSFPEKLLRFSQPHLSATVWGRSRVRTGRLLLKLPRRSLLRVHTDGIWTGATWAELAALAESPGPFLASPAAPLAPGDWRAKARIRGPLPRPRSEDDLLTLAALAAIEQGKAG